MNRKIVDTHCHLNDIENIEQAILQAEKAGVIAIVNMGCEHNSNVKALEISEQYKSDYKRKIWRDRGNCRNSKRQGYNR